jgi:hypothetical protein
VRIVALQYDNIGAACLTVSKCLTVSNRPYTSSGVYPRFTLRQVRLRSGLIPMACVFPHLVNHTLALEGF